MLFILFLLFLLLGIEIYGEKVNPFEQAGQSMFELGVSDGLWRYQSKSIGYWDNGFHNLDLKFNRDSWNNFTSWFRIPYIDDPEQEKYMLAVDNIRHKFAVDVLNYYDKDLYSNWTLIDFVSTFDFGLKYVFLSYNTVVGDFYGTPKIQMYMSYWLQQLLDATSIAKDNTPLDKAVDVEIFNKIYSFIGDFPVLKKLAPNFSFTIYGKLDNIKPYWNSFIKGMYQNAFSYNNSDHYIP